MLKLSSEEWTYFCLGGKFVLIVAFFFFLDILQNENHW